MSDQFHHPHEKQIRTFSYPLSAKLDAHGDLSLRFALNSIMVSPRFAKNLAPPFLSIFSGSKMMTSKINVL